MPRLVLYSASLFVLSARRLAAAFVLLLIVLGVPSAPAARRTLPTPQSLSDWTSRVRMAEGRLHEDWTVMVEDLATSQPVFYYQPQKRLTPASNRKLITFGLALEKLGPDFRFKTEFGLDQPFDGARAHYHGDLVLRSNGDPSLAPPFLDGGANPLDLLREWCQTAARLGIAYVHGNLVIDASAFGPGQDAYPAAWDRSHRDYSYAPVPTALTFCQNLLRVTVRPSTRTGQPARLTLYPSGDGIDLINQTHTQGSGGNGVAAHFNEESGDLVISGRIRRGAGDEVMLVPLPHPLATASEQCRAAVDAAGISLTGSLVVATRHEASQTTGTIVQPLGVHESPPLNRVLATMMRQSDNFLAEQVWRATAARVTGQGDPLTARRIEQAWLKDHGLSWIEPGWDGSGLSRKNGFSANEMVLIARTIYDSAYRDIMFDCLPVSGRTGTLRHRTFGRSVGRVVAKTGTLSGASALTGFIRDRDGQPRLVFSIIGNAPGETNGRLAMRIDQLMDIMIRHLDADSLPRAAAIETDTRPLPPIQGDFEEEVPAGNKRDFDPAEAGGGVPDK